MVITFKGQVIGSSYGESTPIKSTSPSLGSGGGVVNTVSSPIVGIAKPGTPPVDYKPTTTSSSPIPRDSTGEINVYTQGSENYYKQQEYNKQQVANKAIASKQATGEIGTLYIKEKGQTTSSIERAAGIPKGTGLPSIKPPSQAQVEQFYASQKIVSPNETLIKQVLSQPSQTVTQRFMQQTPVGVQAGLAKTALSKPIGQRTLAEQRAIESVASTIAYQKAQATQAQLQQQIIQSNIQRKTFAENLTGQPIKLQPIENQTTKFEKYGITAGFEKVKEKPKISNVGEYILEVGKGGLEYTSDFIETMRTESKKSLKPEYRNDSLTIALKSIPITFGTLLFAPISTGLELTRGGIQQVPEKVYGLVDTPKKLGGLIITTLAFKGAAKVPFPGKTLLTLGTPKVKFSELKTSTEAFPTIKGGVAELKTKLIIGQTQKVFKQQFPELFQKKQPIAIRTTTKTTTLEGVKKFAQYEEVAPFYGTEPSLIGLPQFKGLQQQVIPRLSLFKAGTEQGMIEALVPKGFKLLPTTKMARTISFLEYKTLSEFVGIKLENLAPSIKGLPRIKVKVGENILAKEFSKVSTGRRPFKLRELDIITGGRTATMKAFIEPKASSGFVYPTRAFQLGATTESEVVLFATKGLTLERLGAKGLRQKYLGTPSLITTEGFQSAGIKFYKPVLAVELAKKPLLDRISISLESFRLASARSAAARFSRGQVYEYRPLVTFGRVGALSVISRPIERVAERVLPRELSVVSREIVSRRNVSPERLTISRISEPIREVPIRTSFDFRTISEPSRVDIPRVTENLRSIDYPTPVRPRIVTPERIGFKYYIPPFPVGKYPKTRFSSFDVKKNKKLGKGYFVFIRKKGKAIKISKEPLSYGLALATGKAATRSGLSQSFFIKTFGYTKYEETKAPSLAEYRLKKPTSKIKEQVFIEKNPLATKQEQGLIQQAKKSKRSLFG